MRYLLIWALLTACATTAKYDAMLNTWKGDSVDHLVLKWGAPAKTFTTDSGLSVYEYRYSGATSSTTSYNPLTKQAETDTDTPWCKTSFFAKDSKIVNWRWEGNACRK